MQSCPQLTPPTLWRALRWVPPPTKEPPKAQLSAIFFLLQSTWAHENSRDGRLVWTGIQEHLVSTGFNKVGLLPEE